MSISPGSTFHVTGAAPARLASEPICLAVVVADDPRFAAVLETALYHDSDERTAVERFYGEVLGLPKVAAWEDGMAFRVGPGVLLLFDREKLPARQDPMAAHGTSGDGHVCLQARDGDYEAWKSRLEGDDVAIAHEHEWERGFRSFYFSDPAGNLLEIADGDLWPGAG